MLGGSYFHCFHATTPGPDQIGSPETMFGSGHEAAKTVRRAVESETTATSV